MPVEVECDNCGETTEKKPCRVERTENDFCSPECHNEFQTTITGEDHPAYKERATYTCEYCGEENETTPNEAEKSVYCDQDCMAADFETRLEGDNNPSWNGGLDEITCEWCGNTAEFVPAEAEVRRFCCMRCYKDWLSEKRQGEAWVGEDNPAWRGGQERHRVYGPNWEEQREAALERDGYECIRCGGDDDLNVHHKVPLRNFDRDKPRWHERANALDNLVTLCRSCHSEIHGNPEEHLFDYIG